MLTYGARERKSVFFHISFPRVTISWEQLELVCLLQVTILFISVMRIRPVWGLTRLLDIWTIK